MAPVMQAIQSGATRGARLALNPTVENYRALRTPPKSSTQTIVMVWMGVGRSLDWAMDQEKRSQASNARS